MTLVRYVRFVIGRAIIHLGLRIMPEGRVKKELHDLFDRWAQNVYRENAGNANTTVH